MRLSIRYDVGEGDQVRAISPRAMVAWELASKSKVSDFAHGIAVGDLVTMLFEQMKVDGDQPATRAELLSALVDIGPDAGGESPTPPDEAASSDS